MYARITKDLLFCGDGILDDRTDEILFGDPEVRVSYPKFERVRLLDDDRIPYYELVIEVDDESMDRVFEWGMRDSGATILQNREGGKWVDCMS